MDIFKLFYQIDRCTSNPHAEALILLHGLGLNTQIWDPLVILLSERYHVIRYDLRGHGQSFHNGSELTWELLCADLDSLFNLCGIAEAHVIGYGFGGSLAVRYGASRTERIKTYTLMSTIGFYPPEVMARSIQLRRGYVRNGTANELAEQMASLITSLPPDREEVGRIREAYMQCDIDVYFKGIELFAASNPLDEMSGINKPCLVMAGEKDTIYPSYMSEITAQFIPNAISVIVPDAANMLFMDNPVYTVQKIFTFLTDSKMGRETVVASNPQLGMTGSDAIKMFGKAYQKASSLEALLQVKLIGTFQVSFKGIEIHNGWQQRNAKRLLVYLLFHPHAAREQICDALWPLVDTSKASNLLRVSLSHMKALFEAAGVVSPIVADRTHVKLNAAVECDVLEWIRMLGEARMEKHPSRKVMLVKELLAYPIEELLAGLYDNWALHERSRLEYMLLELVESLVESYKNDGDHLAANQVTRRLSNMFGEEMSVDVDSNRFNQREVRVH
ncbi:alpha/beta hydrolase [Paenibacillus sp. PL91]|uniref:alpha/beta hydrolase n=1 Tax=Paenibacillus sp. PL91 TaxID=2729538 RepID=UPI00145EC520|nr:alpha/beta hydrolase [Paenibacillus sp. PL91]MBC9202877.1 alpha/beta fold hydrolase [Paenibacillus sp. PL91]